LAFRKTCNKWIEEIATMADATLIFRLPASSLPSQVRSVFASSKRLTKFS